MGRVVSGQMPLDALDYILTSPSSKAIYVRPGTGGKGAASTRCADELMGVRTRVDGTIEAAVSAAVVGGALPRFILKRVAKAMEETGGPDVAAVVAEMADSFQESDDC
jgi:hypothetical protein